MTSAPYSADFCPLFGGRLPVEILIRHIMTFIPFQSAYINVASTSKGLMAAMSSRMAEQLWGSVNLQVCIDPLCPLCPFKRAPNRDAPNSILRKYPIACLDVHCLVSDLPVLLRSLASRASIRKIRITLSNKSNTPVLGKLLTGTILDPISFNQLRYLTIDSSHLTVVGLPGRVRILQAMGHHLESLALLGKSVSGIFTAINEYCPQLKELRVDRVESENDLSKYWNLSLLDLTLNRVGFMPRCLREVSPNIQKLTLTFTCRHSESAYAIFLSSLPSSLEALDLEVPGDCASTILCSIGQALPQLKELKLRGSYCCGIMSVDAVSKLLSGCPYLWRFEAAGALSAMPLRLAPLAVPCLAIGAKLSHLNLRFDNRVAEMFPTLLSRPHALTNITLWDQKKWLPESSSWDEMQARVTRVRAAHPGLKLQLVDRS